MSHTSTHARTVPSGARQELTGTAPEANIIPKLRSSGKVDTDILDGTEVTAILDYATEVVQGVVVLAADGDTAALEAVQGNDSRIHTDLTVTDDHPQYALIDGRTGGQILVGGDAASNSLTLVGTSDVTAGPVIIETTSGTEVARFEPSNGALIIGATVPLGTELLRVAGEGTVETDLNIGGVFNHAGTDLGVFGTLPTTRTAAYTRTYSTADRTLGAYTPDDESVGYTQVGAGGDTVDITDVAKLTDLNALRVAVENLRTFVEDAVGMLNSVVDDFQLYGHLQ